MIDSDDMTVPLMMAEVRKILDKRIGQHTIRAEGGSLVITHGTKYASAWIPDINDLVPQSQAIAQELEDGLTH